MAYVIFFRHNKKFKLLVKNAKLACVIIFAKSLFNPLKNNGKR